MCMIYCAIFSQSFLVASCTEDLGNEKKKKRDLQDVREFHPDYINNPIISPRGALTRAEELNAIMPYQSILDANAILKW